MKTVVSGPVERPKSVSFAVAKESKDLIYVRVDDPQNIDYILPSNTYGKEGPILLRTGTGKEKSSTFITQLGVTYQKGWVNTEWLPFNGTISLSN